MTRVTLHPDTLARLDWLCRRGGLPRAQQLGALVDLAYHEALETMPRAEGDPSDPYPEPEEASP